MLTVPSPWLSGDQKEPLILINYFAVNADYFAKKNKKKLFSDF